MNPLPSTLELLRDLARIVRAHVPETLAALALTALVCYFNGW